MIYKGSIINGGNSKKLKVRIDLFGKEEYEVCGYATIPGVDYSALKADTQVYVCFLNNDLSMPVVVGVDTTSPLFSFPLDGKEKDIVSSHSTAATSVNFDSVVINTSLQLPEDSTIGKPDSNGDNKLVTQKDLDEALTNILNKIKEELSI